MRISDWSSDVCSSDLKLVEPFLKPTDTMGEDVALLIARQPRHRLGGAHGAGDRFVDYVGGRKRGAESDLAGRFVDHRKVDRKSVVEGKSVAIRVDPGGRRILKNKKIYKTNNIA